MALANGLLAFLYILHMYLDFIWCIERIPTSYITEGLEFFYSFLIQCGVIDTCKTRRSVLIPVN